MVLPRIMKKCNYTLHLPEYPLFPRDTKNIIKMYKEEHYMASKLH